jgi:hypothetical protein
MKPLWNRDPRSLEERAMLDLSAAMSNAKGDLAVSIEDQEKAARYVSDHGWGWWPI